MKGGKSKADKNKCRLGVKKVVNQPKFLEKPKKPLTAFFVFMEDFRKQYKANHHDKKSAKDVGKAGGAQWNSMTAEEKDPYLTKAEKLKEDYAHAMDYYNTRMAATLTKKAGEGSAQAATRTAEAGAGTAEAGAGTAEAGEGTAEAATRSAEVSHAFNDEDHDEGTVEASSAGESSGEDESAD